MKNLSAIMIEAHKIARTLEGDYSARLSAALEIVWLSETLEDMSVAHAHDALLGSDYEARNICKIVLFYSIGFQSDIAENFLTKGYRLSEKQAWCIAYEYKNVA